MPDFLPPQEPAPQFPPPETAARARTPESTASQPPDPAMLPVDPATLPPPQGEPIEARKVERPSPLTGVANAWFAVVAVVIFVGQELLGSDIRYDASMLPLLLLPLAVVLGIALIGFLVGLINWRTTTFIVDDEFRIEHRFISSRTTRIDFTKVQSVDIHSPLVARLLGLAEVRIEVGGGSPQSLRFLTKARAEALRDHLLARMERESAQQLPAAGATPSPEAAHADAPGPHAAHAGKPEVVYRASPANIVVGAFTTLGLGALIGLATTFVIFGLLTPAAPIVMIFALLGVAAIVPVEIMTNWGFTIARSGQGLHIQRGLTTRVQMTLRPNRVQAISIQQSLLMRLVRIYKVRLTVLGNQIGGSDEGSQRNNIDVLIPYGKWDEVRYVVGLVWPEIDPAAIQWYPQAPKGKWLSWFADHWFSIDDRIFASRRRMLSEAVSIVPHARIQGLSFQQGPISRKLGIGDLIAQTIPGPVHIQAKHLDVATLRTLFDDLLARTSRARGNAAAEPALAPRRAAAVDAPPPDGPPEPQP